MCQSIIGLHRTECVHQFFALFSLGGVGGSSGDKATQFGCQGMRVFVAWRLPFIAASLFS